MLRPYYRGCTESSADEIDDEAFNTAYMNIWRFLLALDAIKPVGTKDPQTRKTRKGNEAVFDENFHQLLNLARSLGFTSNAIDKAQDPDTITATRILRENAAHHSVEYTNDTTDIEQIASVLRKNRNNNKCHTALRTKLYTEDNNLDLKERAGTKVWAPPADVILLMPPKKRRVGVTGVYVALATFNTFFRSSDYEVMAVPDGASDGGSEDWSMNEYEFHNDTLEVESAEGERLERQEEEELRDKELLEKERQEKERQEKERQEKEKIGRAHV